jgi:antitoxin ParD1/3/4/toxin ParE1/3/4
MGKKHFASGKRGVMHAGGRRREISDLASCGSGHREHRRLHRARHPDAADRWDAGIHAAILKVAKMPNIGHVRADVLNPKYRFWVVGSYVIAYRIEGRTLIVVRVHGKRDFRKLFP